MARYNVPADMPGANLKAVVHKHVCADCGRGIAIFIDLRDKSQFVACTSQQHDEAGIVREWIAPKGEDTLNMEKQRRIDMVTEQHGESVSVALARRQVPLSGVLTNPQAMDVLRTCWPGADDLALYKGAAICADFGLHPLMKHLYLIPFNTNVGTKDKPVWEEVYEPVLGIGATRLIAARQGRFGYVDNTPRLMTDEEQMVAFGYVDKDNVVSITKLVTVDKLEARGYGRYPKNGKPKGTDKGNSIANMSAIRSERQAFARLSPDARIDEIGVLDEQYEETPSGRVDTRTGELPANGEFHEMSGEAPVPFTEPPEDKETNPATEETPIAQPDTDPPSSRVEMTWLTETAKTLGLRGRDIVAELVKDYKVDGTGTVGEVCNRLTLAQAKTFVHGLQAKLEEKAAE